MTYHTATLPGQKALNNWLTQKLLGGPQPPDPLMDRLTRLEDEQSALRGQLLTERQAREVMEQRHGLEVAALNQQIEVERQERKIVAEALMRSEEREKEKDKDIRLLQSTIETLQTNAAQLTRMLTDQGSEQAALREQLSSQSERLDRQRTIIDAQNEQIAIAKNMAAQAKDESTFWRSVASFILREFDELRAQHGLTAYGSIDRFADLMRTAFRSEASS